MPRTSDNPLLIDAHVHVTEDGNWFNTNHNASVERLLREMDQAGIDKSVLLPITGVTSNECIRRFCSTYPDRLIGFGAVAFKAGDSEATIEVGVARIADMGLQGIKMHQRWQNVRLDSPEIDALVGAAARRSLPITFCGYQRSRTKDLLLNDLAPYNYDALAKRHPDAKIIIAHLGGHRALDAYTVAISNPNVYLDASYSLHKFRGTSVYTDFVYILEHLDRKVLFGSDFPEVSLPTYTRLFRDEIARLTDCDHVALCAGNLLSLLPGAK
jgi:predicted TIM-barrel fold metal-dependent hydrolase